MVNTSPETRPNILWVCTDSQRWDTLGCYGNPFVKTPVADKLAEEGVRFEYAFCQNPLCTPSRGSFLTGRYPTATRLRQNGQVCPPDLCPISRTLADAGYVCGLSGKLHLSPCDNRLLLGEEWWKQDKSLYFKGREPRIDDGYGEVYWDHAANPSDRSSDYTRWLRERGRLPLNKPKRADCPFVLEGASSEDHQATWCVEKAIGFLESHAGAHYPWMFSVNIFDPHAHFDPPRAFLEPYLERLDEIPLPNFDPAELEAKPTVMQERHVKAYDGKSERDHRLIRAAYWAMCDHIDVQLGRLLEALDRTGQRDNTIVIFTSDHGEMLGDHGLYIKGPFLYDEAIRVPLIIRWPGKIARGRTSRALVELTDLAPTLMEAVGMEPRPDMQGRSLWPMLSGAAPLNEHREDVFCEYLNANPDKPRCYLTMIRDHRHKLVAWHGEMVGELYDLQDDPRERHNRWGDPACADVKMQLYQRLAARMAFAAADPQFPRIGVF